jgi:hypothetical protein
MLNNPKLPILLMFLLAGFTSFSQLITKEDVANGLTGNWKLVYENELTEPYSASFIKKRLIKLNKRKKGKEIGITKYGSKINNSINWKFIESDKGIAVLFKGGIWMDEEEFIVTKITPNKITMLSCGKNDNCDNAYFIKE